MAPMPASGRPSSAARRPSGGRHFVTRSNSSASAPNPVHMKNPPHGSDRLSLAQPARAPIATPSSAMNNHRPLSPISEHPIRHPSPAAKFGLQCGVVEAVGSGSSGAPRDPMSEKFVTDVEKNARMASRPGAPAPTSVLNPARSYFAFFGRWERVADPGQVARETGPTWATSPSSPSVSHIGMVCASSHSHAAAHNRQHYQCVGHAARCQYTTQPATSPLHRQELLTDCR
jgi:hypothetical protein